MKWEVTGGAASPYSFPSMVAKLGKSEPSLSNNFNVNWWLVQNNSLIWQVCKIKLRTCLQGEFLLKSVHLLQWFKSILTINFWHQCTVIQRWSKIKKMKTLILRKHWNKMKLDTYLESKQLLFLRFDEKKPLNQASDMT